MSTITITPIPQSQIADAIASQLARRKQRFREMLTAVADGRELPPDALDVAAAAGVSADALPAHIELTMRRRELSRAAMVDPEIEAADAKLNQELKQLAKVEEQRLAGAEAARQQYEIAKRHLQNKVESLAYHFAAARDAGAELSRTVDEKLAKKAAALEKQRTAMRHAASGTNERMRRRIAEKAPSWETDEMGTQIRALESRIEAIDAEIAAVKTELHEIL